MDHQLINKKYHILQRQKILKDNDMFIYDEIGNRLISSLEGININIKKCLEIGFSSNKISRFILSKFKNINYLTVDISNKILKKIHLPNKGAYLDHDNWEMTEKFDIIISNLYLHLTNDFDLLLKNIYNSLNHNGFLIAAVPGINCSAELKNAMIKADLEFYNGAFKRFANFFSVQDMANFLKKNNFKIPLLEIDTLQLKYKNFNSLLRDLRYMGNSYIFFDRKKNFENKRYFERVEEIYWEDYSNNNEIILHIEILYISAWKNN